MPALEGTSGVDASLSIFINRFSGSGSPGRVTWRARRLRRLPDYREHPRRVASAGCLHPKDTAVLRAGRKLDIALGSSPGGTRPILSRWRRILRTPAESVMTAMSLISDPHRGQSNGLSLSASRPAVPPWGSISYTFALSLAHAERQAACDTVEAPWLWPEGTSASRGTAATHWGRHARRVARDASARCIGDACQFFSTRAAGRACPPAR
jgi:hypothetical protein